MKPDSQYLNEPKDQALGTGFRNLFIKTSLLVVVFLATVYFINYYQKKAISSERQLAHARNVMFVSERMLSLIKDYETETRGFVISNNENFLAPLPLTRDSVQRSLRRLTKLVSRDAVQLATIDSLAYYTQQRFQISDSGVQLRKTAGIEAAMAWVSSGRGKSCMDTIRALNHRVQMREDRVLRENLASSYEIAQLNRAMTLASLVIFFSGLVFLFWQAWFNLKDYNNRQKEVNGILRESARRLEDAQKIAHVGSWEWHPASGMMKWSDELYRIFGYDPGTVSVSHPFFMEAIYPPDRKAVEAIVAEALKQEDKYSAHFRVVQPNGWIKNVHALGEVRKLPEGELLVTGTVQDITGEVSNEKEKKQLAQMLNKTNEDARIGWWEMDMISGQRKWSSVTRELFEVSSDFEPGSNFGYLFVKDADSRHRYEAALAAAVSHGQAYDLVLDVVTARNNPLTVRAIGQAEFEDGICIRVYGTFHAVEPIAPTAKNLVTA